MPRKITDDAGNEVEVFDPSEVEEAKTAAASAAAEAKAKELEPEINPNWREARKTIDQLKDENEKLKKGETVPPPAVSVEDVTRIAQEKAEQTYLQRYRERVAGQFGDKRETVDKYAEKLLAGEKITEDMIDRVYADAARAVGIRQASDQELQSRYVRGSAPVFKAEGDDKGFGATESGKATADAMGIMIDKPKQ